MNDSSGVTPTKSSPRTHQETVMYGFLRTNLYREESHISSVIMLATEKIPYEYTPKKDEEWTIARGQLVVIPTNTDIASGELDGDDDDRNNDTFVLKADEVYYLFARTDCIVTCIHTKPQSEEAETSNEPTPATDVNKQDAGKGSENSGQLTPQLLVRMTDAG